MNNYFLLHGSFSSPFSNWIPYLREKLESLEKIVYTPDLPSGVGYQSYDSWKKIMDVYLDCGLINENTIIFAHSIAPVFIRSYKNRIIFIPIIMVSFIIIFIGIEVEWSHFSRRVS